MKLHPARCTRYDACKPVCEPGIDPITQSAGLECDNCGVCIWHCPEAALYYTIGLPGRTSRSLAPPDPMPERRPDETNLTGANKTGARSNRLPVIVSVVFLLFPAVPANGHHILGLPRIVRNISIATVLFVGLTWVELGFGVTMRPAATATSPSRCS